MTGITPGPLAGQTVLVTGGTGGKWMQFCNWRWSAPSRR
jgi:hypothetical protein